MKLSLNVQKNIDKAIIFGGSACGQICKTFSTPLLYFSFRTWKGFMVLRVVFLKRKLRRYTKLFWGCEIVFNLIGNVLYKLIRFETSACVHFLLISRRIKKTKKKFPTGNFSQSVDILNDSWLVSHCSKTNKRTIKIQSSSLLFPVLKWILKSLIYRQKPPRFFPTAGATSVETYKSRNYSGTEARYENALHKNRHITETQFW